MNHLRPYNESNVLNDILNIAVDDPDIRISKIRNCNSYSFNCENRIKYGGYLIEVCNNISDRLNNEDMDHVATVFIDRFVKLKI